MSIWLLKKSLALLSRACHGERGQVLVVVVLFLSVLGGMAAIAIDLGSYSADRRDLQNAADATALAASQDLPNASTVNTTATSWQTKNKAGNATMAVTVTQQNLPNTPNPTVKITLTRSHSFTFARLVGITSSDVSASATAIRTSPGGSDGLVPWSVQQAYLTTITPGTSVVMKYDSNNATNGNFGAIRIDGSGSSIYRDTIEFGSNTGLCAAGITGCPYSSTVEAQTGNMAGPTETAVNYLMDNTPAACDTWAEVTLVANGRTTLNPACNPFIAGGNPQSLRIIIIPVVASLCNGSCTMTITDFALFFVEGYADGGCTGSDCNIQGRFINSNTNYNAQIGIFNPNSLAQFVRLTQ